MVSGLSDISAGVANHNRTTRSRWAIEIESPSYYLNTNHNATRCQVEPSNARIFDAAVESMVKAQSAGSAITVRRYVVV